MYDTASCLHRQDIYGTPALLLEIYTLNSSATALPCAAAGHSHRAVSSGRQQAKLLLVLRDCCVGSDRGYRLQQSPGGYN